MTCLASAEYAVVYAARVHFITPQRATMNHIKLHTCAYTQVVHQFCFSLLLCAQYNILQTILPALHGAM